MYVAHGLQGQSEGDQNYIVLPLTHSTKQLLLVTFCDTTVEIGSAS